MSSSVKEMKMGKLVNIVIDRIISDLNKLRDTPYEEILGKLERFWIGELSVILGSELIRKDTLEKIVNGKVEESTNYIMNHFKDRVEITKNQLLVMSILTATSMFNQVFQCLQSSTNLCDSCPAKDECPLSKPYSERNPFESFGSNEGGHA